MNFNCLPGNPQPLPCTHTYIHTDRHTYIHTLHTYIHAYMHTCMHACIHTYIQTLHTYIHIYIYISHIYIHTLNIYIYISLLFTHLMLPRYPSGLCSRNRSKHCGLDTANKPKNHFSPIQQGHLKLNSKSSSSNPTGRAGSGPKKSLQPVTPSTVERDNCASLVFAPDVAKISQRPLLEKPVQTLWLGHCK